MPVSDGYLTYSVTGSNNTTHAMDESDVAQGRWLFAEAYPLVGITWLSQYNTTSGPQSHRPGELFL